MKCVQCGSTRIIPRAAIIDRDKWERQLTASVCGNPQALIFTDPEYSTLYARICGDCGFTELFAENPSALYDAYLQSQQR